MSEKNFDNWNDYYEYFEQLRSERGLKGQVGFRGQKRVGWTLRPSLARQLPKNCTFEKAIEIEKQRLEKFRQDAPHRNLSKFEIPHPCDEDRFMHWLSDMQQYRAPTRLLDWTFCPYIAAHFAVKESPDEDGEVWIHYYQKLLDALEVPPISEVSRARIFKTFTGKAETPSTPPGIRPSFQEPPLPVRKCAQQGFYLFCDDPRRDHDEVMSGIAEKADVKPFHRKVIIKAEAKQEFLYNLHKMNITESSLLPPFPELDSLGKSITEDGKLIANGLMTHRCL